jgi:hypothetical protein
MLLQYFVPKFLVALNIWYTHFHRLLWSVSSQTNYSSLPLKYAPVYVRILVKYTFFGKKFRVQDLLVEHVITDP